MGKFIRKTREEREDEILSAALKVFLQKGYRKTTMEDIIKQTTLSKGGFYHYFRSTKEILIAIFGKRPQEELRFLAEIKFSSRDQKDLVEKLALHLTERMLAKFEERELYLMGVCEAFDDLEFLERLNKMEEEFIRDVVPYSQVNFSTDDPMKVEAKLMFLSKVFHALVIGCHLFKQERLYQENKGHIKNLFAQILADI